jgi:hypothetical protein
VLTELRVGCVCVCVVMVGSSCQHGCETNNARQPRNKDGPQVRTSWTVRVRGAILLVHSRYYTLQCGACAERKATAEREGRRDFFLSFFAVPRGGARRGARRGPRCGLHPFQTWCMGRGCG